MIRDIDALILHAANPQATVAFYQALGLPLEEQEDVFGEKHFACELGVLHFAIFKAKEDGAVGGRRAGSSQLGFQVDELESMTAVLKKMKVVFSVEPEDVPWGRRIVVVDPDGRLLELIQPRLTGQFPSMPMGTI